MFRICPTNRTANVYFWRQLEQLNRENTEIRNSEYQNHNWEDTGFLEAQLVGPIDTLWARRR